MKKVNVAMFLVGLLSSFSAWSAGVTPKEMVLAHNIWRAQVGVGGVTYSEELAASAQAWADHLKTTRNCSMQHSQGKEGENLYWAGAWSNGPAQDVMSKEVVDSWASEKKDYTYADNSCAAGKVCGHYTQVVWRDTTTVGCGMAMCDSPKNQVWVCQYLPAGNWVGQKPY
ncbi:MAG: CAP domain-containing protein [Gallionella sp.]|jgi:pathogenesis-related protein 1|nr:CAP domain-containing protein [Gallionella sp.]MDD4960492.1 CAP domain-containing protein [Gallionella sp.]